MVVERLHRAGSSTQVKEQELAGSGAGSDIHAIEKSARREGTATFRRKLFDHLKKTGKKKTQRKITRKERMEEYSNALEYLYE